MTEKIIDIKDGRMYVEISEDGHVAVGKGNAAKGTIVEVEDTKKVNVNEPWMVKTSVGFIDRATWHSGSPLCFWHGDREY